MSGAYALNVIAFFICLGCAIWMLIEDSPGFAIVNFAFAGLNAFFVVQAVAS